MKEDPSEAVKIAEAEGRSYSAPALEKGFDILETLCRSVGEIYRMVACLVSRNYLTLVDDNA
jgi:hypothetical protein